MNKSSRELNKCIRGLFDEGIDKFYERVNNAPFVNVRVAPVVALRATV